MSCYCEERQSNPELAREMADIPDGYCGFCDLCGQPGHTRAHPDSPTTGAWCDEHWKALLNRSSFSPANLIRYGFYLAIFGLFSYSAFSALRTFFG